MTMAELKALKKCRIAFIHDKQKVAFSLTKDEQFTEDNEEIVEKLLNTKLVTQIQ